METIENKDPLLVIVTRCCRRPKKLERNKRSLQVQTNKDWRQVFIVDNVGKGLLWANRQLYVHREEAKGSYVFIIDDDDYLIRSDFVEMFKKMLDRNASPDVIILRTMINRREYPTGRCRAEKYPRRTHIGTSCIIVKNEIYQEHIEKFGQAIEGDFLYIKSVFDAQKYNIYWWDFMGVQSEIGRGGTEREGV